MEESIGDRRRNFVLLVASGIAILAVIAFGLYSLSGGSGGSKPKPPKISLIPLTPPPPPPPPKEEKKPEPPKEQREVKMEQPQLKDAPPPDQTLKMEGPAGNSPSGIQAGTVSNENLSNIGGTGNRAGNPFAFYTSMLQQQLQSEFSRNQKLRNGDYRALIRIWIAKDGSISRYELAGSSGNAQTDELIKSALASMPPFRDPPPDTMPQPVRLRITSRSTG